MCVFTKLSEKFGRVLLVRPAGIGECKPRFNLSIPDFKYPALKFHPVNENVLSDDQQDYKQTV